MVRVVRGLGWTLVVSGAVVLLYVVYLLWFTNFETERAQSDLAESWSTIVAAPEQETAPEREPGAEPQAGSEDGDLGPDPIVDPPRIPREEEEELELGEAYAALWFERDGTRIVNDEVLYVLEGVSLTVLRSGPGHYPDSDRAGGAGNLAIAGHRTTYGAPFWSLDVLTEGDTIHVVDRLGNEWVYAYREQRVVAPTAVWVVDRDPLGTGTPTITLTTCHPRGSDRQRLIAFGELVGDPIDSTAGEVAVEELAET